MLESLRNVTYDNIEVIVVDNGSEGDDADRIEAAFPEAHLIRNARNQGYTGGNNIGIRHSQGEYVLLLNNDTIVEPTFLDELVGALESNPTAGIASAKILYTDPAGTIQYAGSTPINPLTVRGASIGCGEKDRGQHDQLRETALPHGAVLMIRRSLLKDIGLLWEDFFIYYEEYDFAERAKRNGHSILFVPSSVIHHKESATVGKASAFKTYFMTRNRLLFLRRNAFGTQFLIGAAFFFVLALPKAIVTMLFTGRIDLARAAIRGVAWHVRHPRLSGETLLGASSQLVPNHV
jgi:GT2 family glycosyltransferase